jgi:hypothetical protein
MAQQGIHAACGIEWGLDDLPRGRVQPIGIYQAAKKHAREQVETVGGQTLDRESRLLKNTTQVNAIAYCSIAKSTGFGLVSLGTFLE